MVSKEMNEPKPGWYMTGASHSPSFEGEPRADLMFVHVTEHLLGTIKDVRGQLISMVSGSEPGGTCVSLSFYPPCLEILLAECPWEFEEAGFCGLDVEKVERVLDGDALFPPLSEDGTLPEPLDRMESSECPLVDCDSECFHLRYQPGSTMFPTDLEFRCNVKNTDMEVHSPGLAYLFFPQDNGLETTIY